MRRGPLFDRVERGARAGPVAAGPARSPRGYDRPSMLRPLPFVLLVAVVAAGCGGGDESGGGGEDGGETAAAQSSAGCRTVEAPAAEERTAPKPTTRLDPSNRYRLTLHTNCGSFTILLDVKGAPTTSASLVSLARRGYFDDTVFHRIVPEFVIQGGDPTATGTGGPGYTTVDTPAKDTQYTLGTVAMAKTAAEPRGAGGSQFFVVTSDELQLPGDYGVIGEVTSGFETVARIGGY